ncbi:conserved repeat domain protein [[Leptolyngbya] sp. PCC 7376]|uniref:beta strand repeat-containing protein n=1 Tax=[Leptolyngbya] sp. PCC 7376 TaxID=111781 RepID=UPI00029F34EA|nr:DUF11 domain-containing protein [[Leptolyngbya] sp. PCC 7376]AFY37216.1 conserved repeat domain protein [[Leptolyngbya] sp. PCC 7376]
MASKKPQRHQNFFQRFPALIWQAWLGLFYGVMDWLLPKSWRDPEQPASKLPILGVLQRRSQISFQRGKARQQRWWDRNTDFPNVTRWVRRWRFRILGVVSAIFFLFLNFVVFISPARAIVNVVPAFDPPSIDPGGVSTAIVQIFNAETFQLTNADLTVNLPSGMDIANPTNAMTDCGSGIVNATIGQSVFDLEGGTVPPRVGSTDGTCTFRVSITTTMQGTSNLVIPANALTTAEGETNSAAGSVGLTVNPVDDPSLSKSFSPSTIFVNNGTPGAVNESTLQVVIANNSTVDLTEVNLTDDLPAGVTTNGPATKDDATCVGGSISQTSTSVTLSNVTIPGRATCTFSVPVVSSTTGSFTNTLAAGSINTRQGVSNASPATADLNVQNSITAPTIEKEFRNDPIGIGDPAVLRINISNESDLVDLQGVELIDIFTDPNIIVADPPNAFIETNGDCAIGGFVDDASGTPGNPAAGDTFFGIQGVTIPAGRTCRIEVDVTATAGGVLPNIIPIGSLSSTQGVTNSNQASDNLRAAEIIVGKNYANGNVANLNVPTTLTITLENTIDSSLTNVQFTDVFTDNSPPLEIAATPNLSTTCGGTPTAIAGSNQVSLSGGTIPANSSCTVTVDVVATGATAGTNRNDIDPGDVTADGGISNRFRARRDLEVNDVASIELEKQFRDDPVNINERSRFRLRIRPDSNVTDLSVTDTLPAGLVIDNPANITTNSNCRDDTGAPLTITAVPGSNTLAASGVEILSGQRCNIQANVVSDTNGSYFNEVPIGAITTNEGSTNTSPASDTLNVIGINLAKEFTPSIIAPGGRSRLRVTFTNNQAFSLTDVNLTDNFPPDTTAIAVANPPNASTTCGGVASATAGGTSLSLTGGTIPAQVGAVPGICTLEVDVTSTESSGNYVNTIPADSMTTAEGISNLEEATATLEFSPLTLTVAKSFNPLSVTAGTASELTVQLFNPSPSEEYLDVSFVDNMPTGMQVFAPPNASTTCTDGVISANSGDGSFSLSGATLPANSSCIVTLDVTSTVNATLINTIPVAGASTFQGATNTTPATASLANSPGVGVAKEFTPNIVEPGGTSRLTITVINGNDTQALTDLDLTDVMPVGVDLAATPNIANDCGGTVNPNTAADPDQLELTGASLGTESTCQFSADVVVTNPGSYENQIPAGSITTAEGASNPVAVSDTLVAAQRPSITKAFSPDVINPGGTSTLTLNLGNTNTNPITLTSTLTDTLPTNVAIASTPNIGGTCTNGDITATAGGGTVTYANGAAIPNGGCTISVDVTSTVSGSYTNTIPAGDLQTTAGNNPDPATDDLLVRTPPSIAKSFSPNSIAPNGTSVLTITLSNVNADPQTLTSDLIDTLPDDVVIAGTPNIGGTCTTSSVTAVAGSNMVTYATGAIIPNGSCTITVDVTAATEGTKTNVIPVGELVTDVGSNNTPATDDLIVTTTVSTDAELILVKRISAVRRGGAILGTGDRPGGQDTFVFNDFVAAPGETEPTILARAAEDNDPNWPDPDNTYLSGALDAGEIQPGDEVEYTIYFLNSGDASAESVRLCDVVPDNMSYVPSSMELFLDNTDPIGSPTSPEAGTLLNATSGLSDSYLDGDRGSFYPPGIAPVPSTLCQRGSTNVDSGSTNTTGAVVIQIVDSTTTPSQIDGATAPGTPPNSYGFIRFRVTTE